jgi:putative aldouronate transport system permease protein
MKQVAAEKQPAKLKKESNFVKMIKRYGGYYVLLILPIAYFILFKYVPMFGNVLAFRKYSVTNPLFGSEWVGFRYFEQFLGSPEFWQKFSNTLILSVSCLVFTFPLPIIFALLLNEVQNVYFKKFVQTASYLPHFISMVVVAGFILQILSTNGGTLNNIRAWFGLEPINFIMEPQYFRAIYIISEIWQGVGWNAIIFIAALSGIDPALLEAGVIDGTNKFQEIIYVSLPCIAPTIIISLILSVGGILGIGYEKVLLLMNDLNKETADVLSTYVYRMGLASSSPQYSYSTAVGLFEAVIGLILVGSANFISGKISETSLW